MASREPEIKQAISIDISDDGIAATHPITVQFPKPVATTTPGKKTHNTIKDFLVVVGCSLVPDFLFAFDSSLPTPDISQATRKLARLREELKDFEGLKPDERKVHPPLSLFGHADPVGRIAYNSRLSQRRASAVYAMLIREEVIWEKLFEDRSLAGDAWGDEELGIMLDLVGLDPEFPKGSGDPAGRAAALKRLKSKGAGKAARALLFRAYMDAVCVQEDDDGNVTGFELKRTDFLARGRHPDAKGDVQGCGEFNPVFIQPQEDIDRFERTPDSSPEKPILEAVRDAANAPDRRVVVFFFKPGTEINPTKWPCPHRNQKNAPEVCRKRFWSDGDKRLKPAPKEAREFRKTADTFACRFYHGFAQNSPCEGALKLWPLRIGRDDRLVTDANGDIVPDEKGRATLQHPIANRRFTAFVAGGDTGVEADTPVVRGRTNAKGELRLPVFDEKTTMTLKIDAFTVVFAPKTQEEETKETPEEKFVSLSLKAGDLALLDSSKPDSEQTRLGTKQRLFNLGYGSHRDIGEWTDADLKNARNAFQRKHNLKDQNRKGEPDEEDSPELTRRTLELLKAVYGS